MILTKDIPETNMIEMTKLPERKPIYFDPCPDCGVTSRIEDLKFWRESESLYNDILATNLLSNRLRVVCPICGWTTSFLNSVADCAKYWNEYDISNDIEDSELKKTYSTITRRVDKRFYDSILHDERRYSNESVIREEMFNKQRGLKGVIDDKIFNQQSNS